MFITALAVAEQMTSFLRASRGLRGLFSSPTATAAAATAAAAADASRASSNLVAKVSKRSSGFGDTVWTEFTPLAVKHNAVNLSQGLSTIDVAPFILEKVAQVSEKGMHHQYTRSAGHLRLVNIVAKHFGPLLNRTIDPITDIVITTGATQGLFLFFQTFVNPGDEVIIIEPFYDSYQPQIEMAGGVAVPVPLVPDAGATSSAGWRLRREDLEQAFSSKTKAIVLNTPHNPTGKVLSVEELTMIGELAAKHDVLVLSDEVYEKLIYDGAAFTKTASVPGLWERTITLGSAGKAFNLTGWKIGWAIGPKELIRPMQNTNQYIPFSVTTPLQEALARAWEEAEGNGFFDAQIADFARKRKLMIDVLTSAGLRPYAPQASYFVVADISVLDLPKDMESKAPFRADYDFCRWLTKDIGVAAIPPSCFYSPQHADMGANYARFCFAKKDEDIIKAGERLLKLRQYLR